ncbi:MAG TPA: DUF1015 domain-containing protein [Thermoanaerobaculia bacterium]|nr:DUF1015 domain-containing protein [Thermoanaerobaculia bacterium]
MRIFAFEGLRYTPTAGETGELAALPYDQIDNSLRDRYHAQSPYQFVHLTRPVPPEGEDPYRHSAGLHGRWLAEGAVARDPRPALYPYAVELTEGDRRLGLMALVGYEDASHIRPHEQTLDKPLAERLALLEATRVDYEPIFLLSEDGGRLEELLQEDMAAQPIVRHRDPAGHIHLLYKVDDPARIARYQEALQVPAAIADGHHRYKVGQRFAREHGAKEGTAAAAKLAVITSIQSPALTIRPTHRGLRETADLSKLAGVAVTAEPFRGSTGDEMLEAVAAALQPAVGVWIAGHEPEVWHLDPTMVPNATSPGVPQLPVEVLHKTILPALGYPPEAATDGTVVYRDNADQLFTEVKEGTFGTAFWLPPTAPAEFSLAIAGGNMLPPKSTRFMPKVMSGLVWADHDSKLL